MISVEFGSRVRGDYDGLSDRDVLLIANRWSELEVARGHEQWHSHSVSTFTYDTAAFLASRGSLFLKHVFDEGTVVDGPQSRFEELRHKWEPARDYSAEIHENIDLLDLLEFIPASTVGVSAAIDIGISAIRSVLIRRLAERGIYCFAWSRVLAQSEVMGWISADDAFLFRRARKIKNSYRRGTVIDVSRTFASRFFEAVLRVLQRRQPAKLGWHHDISRLPERYEDRSYKQLRALEFLCAEFKTDRTLTGFQNMIKNPSTFSRSKKSLPSGGY